MSDDGRDVPPGRGVVIEPVPAASVLVVRAGYEVLMLRRNSSSGFVPGSWVFPGGALEERDRELARSLSGSDDELGALGICAIRETLEESGVWLGAAAVDTEALRSRLDSGGHLTTGELRGATSNLHPLARWVTPEGLSRRYDTWFFAARAPIDCAVRVDGSEGIEARWIRPDQALEENRAGRLPMVFPTIRNLTVIARFEDVEQLMSSGVAEPIPVFRPMLIERDGKSRIVLPEEV